jgi:hypothetical protein
LHPEFEVRDFEDGTRYIDFAYLRPPHRICIEIDGYGPHVRDVDRWRFGDNLMRQNQMVLDDWKVIRFSLDDITTKQRRSQQFIMHAMGRWYSEHSDTIFLTSREKEVVRLVMDSTVPTKPSDVAAQLGIRREYARDWLHRLHVKGVLSPASGTHRVRSYVLKDPTGRSVKL